MKNDKEKIDKAFRFLYNRARDGRRFTQTELAAGAGWSANNTKTNMSKRLKELIQKEGDDFCARPEMLRVRLDDFRDLFRQKQRLFTEYAVKQNPTVLVYEFFMPLAREDRLREALDNLFYKDTIQQRIREIGTSEIRKALTLRSDMSEEDVEKFVCNFVDNEIRGYSLYLVNGRFRVPSLYTRAEAAKHLPGEGPYLIDEMTAVVRFILPVEESTPPEQTKLFEPITAQSKSSKAEQMRWLFLHLFAEAVTKVVRKEDEIWLLETGRWNVLYRWVRRD